MSETVYFEAVGYSGSGCTVATLAETARINGVSRTALILVGDFLGEDYRRSDLYNPAFSHGFRQG